MTGKEALRIILVYDIHILCVCYMYPCACYVCSSRMLRLSYVGLEPHSLQFFDKIFLRCTFEINVNSTVVAIAAHLVFLVIFVTILNANPP